MRAGIPSRHDTAASRTKYTIAYIIRVMRRSAAGPYSQHVGEVWAATGEDATGIPGREERPNPAVPPAPPRPAPAGGPAPPPPAPARRAMLPVMSGAGHDREDFTTPGSSELFVIMKQPAATVFP
jgi:hypothetical protein